MSTTRGLMGTPSNRGMEVFFGFKFACFSLPKGLWLLLNTFTSALICFQFRFETFKSRAPIFSVLPLAFPLSWGCRSPASQPGLCPQAHWSCWWRWRWQGVTQEPPMDMVQAWWASGGMGGYQGSSPLVWGSSIVSFTSIVYIILGFARGCNCICNQSPVWLFWRTLLDAEVTLT